MAARDDRDKADEAGYDRARRVLLAACGAIAGGLAFAGSLDRMSVGSERIVAGIVVVGGWIAGIYALHRLGRAGSERRDERGSS